MDKLYVFMLVLLLFNHLFSISTAQSSSSDDDDDYVFSKGPVPNKFKKGQRYPDRDEDVECQPIRLRAARGTKIFQKLVTYTGNGLNFKNHDSRIMSSRLHSKLNTLSDLYYTKYNVKLYVLKAWTEYKDDDVPDRSLHYEGRSIRIHVTKNNVTRLLKLAVTDASFDWVQWHTDGYAVLSVIPDVCDISVDMVFVSDQSGSVGRENNEIALQFISDVIDVFTIGENNTQVGLVTYSSYARTRFDLDDYHSKPQIQNVISNIGFPGGATATALGLFQAGVFLNPSQKRGARPLSQGVPRIVVLITDGRSNRYSIEDVSTDLHAAGIQVFTIGIGNIFLPELKFIASDPDRFHVFLLDSFNDASGFVDFLSFSACKAPAIVEPGENTTTEVPEDSFRFFQTECTAFSPSIIIEQIDIYGKCSLYASNVISNPGPLDSYDLVVRNEDRTKDRRSVSLKLKKVLKKIIYISVRGLLVNNMFSVIIWDKLFTQEHFIVYAPEDSVNVEIFDLDQELTVTTEKFSYRIKDGNEGEEFDFDPITGILTVVKPLFINVQEKFELLIVAENVNASCHRGRVKVTIEVVNRGLEFPDPLPVSVPENAQNNTIVTQVEATGGTGVIQYFIEAGNEDGVFELDEDTGEIRIVNSSPIDFETNPRYELTIRAVSTPSSVFVEATQIINILDVNEQPFFVTACAQQGLCTFEALENQTIGAIVDNIIADDPDLSTISNGTLTYMITPAGLPFSIENNGTLRSLVLDRELIDNYEFMVIVTDGGGLTIATNVTVLVIDINDNNPVFATGLLEAFPLAENTPSPAIITEYIATDADINSSPIEYSLRSSVQQNLPFEINSNSGLFSLVAPLDFDEGIRVYFIDVIATDSSGSSSVFPIIITVTDVNDNVPQFNEAPYEAEVVENVQVGTLVVQIQATDLDSGLNGLVSYMILSGNDDNLFRINETTGEIFTNAIIDREIVSMATLLVEARDMGVTQQLFNTTTVSITVLDENDNPPVFNPDQIQVSIPEDQPLGTIRTLMAVDNDQPGNPNSAILYDIVSGNQDNVFAVNSTSGELRLLLSLDFETTPLYTLVVVANDQGSPIMSGNATVTVNVLNVNDNAPIVSGDQDIDVIENEPIGFHIAQFVASDLDQMVVSFMFSDDSNLDGLFAINSTGSITLLQMLDFEQAQRHELLIIVSDGSKTSNTTLRINVIDVNEFSPQFIGSTAFEILEEQPVGTVVGTVTATDSDRDQQVTYSLQFPSSLFSINNTSGVITTVVVLDREALASDGMFLPPDSQTIITVVATDNGVIPSTLSTTAPITITLVDINDNNPMFDRPSYEASINEDVSPIASLITVVAVDSDIGRNGEIEFVLSDQDSLPFAINSSSGEITVIQQLDRENISSYSLTVIAIDNGDTRLSTEVLVNVTVIDVNDNPPMFSAPEISIFLLESASTNVPLFTILANDPDSGQGGDIVYSIQGMELCQGECLFSINSNTASVSINRRLDFETQEQHTFVAIAMDRGIPTLSSNTTVTVIVGNVDEIPPMFAQSCSASISENEPIGTFVVSCIASDFNDVTQTVTSDVQYSVISTEFNIDNDGNITTAVLFDREEQDSYSVLVIARDAAGNVAVQTAVITITDVNDNHLFFIGEPYSFDVNNNVLASYQQDLITVSALDTDLGVNAEVTFTITNVYINETSEKAILTIEASDAGTPPLSNSTEVIINFIDGPCTVQSYTITNNVGTQSATIMGRFLCTISIQPITLNIAVGGSFSLLCNVLRNINATISFSSTVNGFEFTPQLLEQGSNAVFFTKENATEDDTGTYGCSASSVIGGLQTQAGSLVQVTAPPSIISGPEQIVAEVGVSIQFNCLAEDAQQATWNWQYEGTDVASDGSSIFPVQNSLLFLQVKLSDTGEYMCQVENPVGIDSEVGQLTVFDPTSVVQVVITDYSDPDPVNDCNSVNTTDFQSTMKNITGQTTMSTSVTGDSICPPDPCHPNPCINGGLCNIAGNTSYTCVCLVGYTGPNCSEDINECDNSESCFNGSTCVNIPGAFTCNCPSGRFGDSCEFVHETCTCPETYTCIELEGVPSRCTSAPSSGLMIVQDPVPGNTAVLDQVISTLTEDEPTNSKRRKRDTFVTVCKGKFIRSSSNTNNFLLTWSCPPNVERPSDEEIEQFCQFLVLRQLVRSCISPTGNVISVPTVNSTTVRLSFIFIDDSTGLPISASEAIDVLENTDALQKLQVNGLNAVEFQPLVPISTAESVSSSGSVGGAVGGIVVALVIAMVITVIVLILIRRFKRRKRPAYFSDHDTVMMSKMNPIINHNVEAGDDDRYSRIGGLMLPSADKTTYIIAEKDQSSCSPTNPYVGYFDDPVYSSNTNTAKPKRTESTENLLDCTVEDSGEYDTPLPPERTTSLKEIDINHDELDEPIYANMGFQHKDQNIGGRWENYQKTETILHGTKKINLNKYK